MPQVIERLTIQPTVKEGALSAKISLIDRTVPAAQSRNTSVAANQK